MLGAPLFWGGKTTRVRRLAAETGQLVQEGRILVADDDAVFRETVAELLRFEGYKVESAANGVEAVDAVVRWQPSMVLLDLYMPLLDGWGFARELEAAGVHVPIVVMTGEQDAWSVAAGIRAKDWLEKPFRMRDLLPAVARACA